MSKKFTDHTYHVPQSPQYPPKNNNFHHYQSDFNDQKKHISPLRKNDGNIINDSMGFYDKQTSKYIGSILHDSLQNLNRDEDSLMAYESQQNALLRQALIEKHNKLLIEIDSRNLLEDKIKQIEEILERQMEKNKQLSVENNDIKECLRRQRQNAEARNYQKYRELEHRLKNEENKNNQLKQDMDEMRTKLLSQKMVNNNLEELNIELREKIQKLQQQVDEKIQMIRQRDSNIEYLTNQLQNTQFKLQEKEKSVKMLEKQRQALNHNLRQKTRAENQLTIELNKQFDKNTHLHNQIISLKNQQQQIIENMQRQFEEKIYSLQKELEREKANCRDKEDKHVEQLKNLNILFREKDRELEMMRKKPMTDAEKKKKNYERTKDLVHRLSTEQFEYEKGVKNQSGGKTNNRSSRSPIGRDKTPSGSYRNIYISSGRISPSDHKNMPGSHHSKTGFRSKENNRSNGGYFDEKSKYLTTINNIQEMQMSLLNCNVQRKKIKAEIERLEETTVQTRQVVGKRKKLQQQLKYQESKIEKVKEELRRMRAL